LLLMLIVLLLLLSFLAIRLLPFVYSKYNGYTVLFVNMFR